MARNSRSLHVVQAPGELSPLSFEWEGRTVRVWYVTAVATQAGADGPERHYRVQTGEGCYELGLNMRTYAWRMCSYPSRLRRAWAEASRTPRFPVAFDRGRCVPDPAILPGAPLVMR